MRSLDQPDEPPVLGPPIRPEPIKPIPIWRPSPHHAGYETNGIETREKPPCLEL